MLGLSLGLVFVPCAGPILAAISAAEANHRIGISSFVVTLFYAVGASLPLLLFAVLAQRAVSGWQKLRVHLPLVRRVAGAVLAVTTLALAVGVLDPLQRDVPGYTSALEDHLESGGSIAKQIEALDGEKPNQFAKKAATTAKMATLPDLGKAPDFTGIVTWFNTPGNKPLSLAQLKGKVVLVDFWTYSCINCQRSLPHVEAWYQDYRDDGLVVVGVSTPEFAFEHVISNVQSAAGSLGIHYPVAIDNNYGTWDAYNNEYWPAEYLIDPTGEVRARTTSARAATPPWRATSDSCSRPTASPRCRRGRTSPTRPPPRKRPPRATWATKRSSTRSGRRSSTTRRSSTKRRPRSPSTASPSTGRWNDHSQEATAGADASIDLHFVANDVYLVMGGTGSVSVSFDGRHLTTIEVSGVPRLYTLFSGSALQTGQLDLDFSPGVQAYDFTFG